MIDDEIKDRLNVDPSPEFMARVRTRIANEPARAAWRGPWTLAVAGAMAAVVVVAVIVSRPQEITRAVPQPRIVQGSVPVASGTTAAPRTSVAATTAPVAQAFRPAPAGLKPRATTAAPEILLDPAETRALRALVDGVHAGRIDLAAAQRSRPAEPMVLAPIGDLEIRVMTIDPLTPAGEQGARQ